MSAAPMGKTRRLVALSWVKKAGAQTCGISSFYSSSAKLTDSNSKEHSPWAESNTELCGGNATLEFLRCWMDVLKPLSPIYLFFDTFPFLEQNFSLPIKIERVKNDPCAEQSQPATEIMSGRTLGIIKLWWKIP